MIPPSELTRTAYHEAGHAVANLALGIPLDYVTLGTEPIITARGELSIRLGETAHIPSGLNRGETLRKDPMGLLNHIVSFLAGSIAEQHFMRKVTGKKPVAGDCGESDDEREARELAIVFLGPSASTRELKSFLAWARIRATGLVRRHWDAISAVAAKLEARRHLLAADIAAAAAPSLESLPKYMR